MIWFRRDLRLADQAAVQAAVAGGRRVVGLFVLEAPAGPWAPGAASRWWLHHSLAALADALAARGGALVLRHGAPETIVPALAAEVGAAAVHALEGFEPREQAAQRAVSAALAERGVALLLHPGALLTDPRRLRTQSGGAFSVYTPFARAAFANLPPLPEVPAPLRIPAPERLPASEPLESWKLLPHRPDWAGGLRAAWTPGEAGAATRLSAFLAGALARYGAQRDMPAIAGTSRLSPHLHWGEISPRQVWSAAAAAATTAP
ncbi:MAG: deoxyribodipyrimidine photo-lyase, partial [Acetobacteraceae bacterium]